MCRDGSRRGAERKESWRTHEGVRLYLYASITATDGLQFIPTVAKKRSSAFNMTANFPQPSRTNVRQHHQLPLPFFFSPSLPLFLSSKHGHITGRGTGDKSPEFGVGEANAKCLPQILSYRPRYKSESFVAFKIRRNPFSVKAMPRTPLGKLTTLPRPP